MPVVTYRKNITAKENGREPVRLPPLPFRKDSDVSGNCGHLSPRVWYGNACKQRRTPDKRQDGKGGERMAKERFVEVYNQGIVNVARIIVDTETGVNYLLASHNKATGTGMTVLVDRDGKPIVTPID